MIHAKVFSSPMYMIGVLDPSDERHYAIIQRENLKPISMFRHENGNILLCYNGKLFEQCCIIKAWH